MDRSVIVLKIYLCAFRLFQQTKLISVRENPINCYQKHFAAAYWKKKTNDKNVIVLTKVYQMSEKKYFLSYGFCFVFSKKADLYLYLYICECRF